MRILLMNHSYLPLIYLKTKTETKNEYKNSQVVNLFMILIIFYVNFNLKSSKKGRIIYDIVQKSQTQFKI
jgi:hypothetical protein